MQIHRDRRILRCPSEGGMTSRFRMRFPQRVLPLAIAVLFLSSFGHAQEYRGTLSGTVTDPSGAVIPGAVVTAKSGEQTYNVKSDNAGRFVIPFAQPNTYEITVKAQGFATAVYPSENGRQRDT